MKRSLAHLPDYKRDKLRRARDVILEVARESKAPDKVTMIILFGSHARDDWVDDETTEGHITYGYHSDYDLLVVVAKRKQAYQRAASGFEAAVRRRLEYYGIENALRREGSVRMIVHDIDFFNKEIERGQFFFTDIKKEGVWLYNDRRFKLARRRKLDPAERAKYAREEFNRWYRAAEDFLTAHHAMLQKKRYNNSVFQLHQAVERFINTAELVFTTYKTKTHDLDKLVPLAGGLHKDFFGVFPRVEEKDKELFKLLQRAYVDARYKKDYKITKRQLEILASRVRKLQRLTKRLCREKIESFTA